MSDPTGSTQPDVPSSGQPPPEVGAEPQAPAPKGVWERLKQHKVAQWTLAYAAAGYTLLHAVEMLSEAQEWPHAIARVLSLVLILGVPIVITLAWYHGARHAHRVSGPELTIITILLVLTGSVLWALTRTNGEYGPVRSAPVAQEAVSHSSGPPAGVPAGVSLAVLPFVDMSPDHNQDYFSDGLSEEVLNQLAQIKELRVTGRTSSFSFKGKNEDLRVIGEKLGVNHLLEGSVRKSDKRLRVTAQLINAADGTHLWSHSYDSELTDVFAVQEDIARAVAQALSVTLDVGEMSRAKGGTTDVEAYDRYLQARTVANRGPGRQALLEGAQLYREALAIDPKFARAWSALYNVLASTLIYIPENSASARKEMADASAHVLTLAPDAWWTHAMRAGQFTEQHRWAEAEAADNAVMAAAPVADAEAVREYSVFLWAVGRAMEATEVWERVRQKDPLSLAVSYALQVSLCMADRTEEFQAENQRSKGLAGDHVPVDLLAALCGTSRTDAEQPAARIRLRQLLQHSGNPLYQSIADKLDNAEAARTEMRKHLGNSSVAAMAFDLGEKDLVLDSLHRSYVDFPGTNIGLIWITSRNGLRADPRFKVLLRDLGLVDYFRASGKWGDFCKPVGAADFECR
jgi:TolB-like protein